MKQNEIHSIRTITIINGGNGTDIKSNRIEWVKWNETRTIELNRMSETKRSQQKEKYECGYDTMNRANTSNNSILFVR